MSLWTADANAKTNPSWIFDRTNYRSGEHPTTVHDTSAVVAVAKQYLTAAYNAGAAVTVIISRSTNDNNNNHDTSNYPLCADENNNNNSSTYELQG